MRKILLIVCCFFIFITGCQKSKPAVRQEVTVNLPTDNTVNGYRKDGEFTADIIPENEVSFSETVTITVSLCGNKNSKVFHKLSCSSVKNMKEENKQYFETEKEFLNNGYKPCKMCNP